MIDPKAITTYAQYNEDIILAALLNGIKNGFYIDIGANYPTIDSVTKYFYEKGWRGINIEPIKSLHKQLVNERPGDINLQIGIGGKQSLLDFREYTNTPGHSTFNLEQKNDHEKEEYVDYSVPVITLNDLFRKYKPRTVHFIKIDVEGYEYEVIKGNDWAKNRPQVICIESNHITKDWRPILQDNKYKEFINDGLNSYYIAEEFWSFTDNFAEKIIELDYHALKQHQSQSWEGDSADLTRLNGLVAELTKKMGQETQQRLIVESLSLKNQTFIKRIKRSVYGLTVDWVRYVKNRKHTR